MSEYKAEVMHPVSTVTANNEMVTQRSFTDELKTATNLYLLTKKLILEAEQLDPKLSSNVAVVKEQRDALDHIMRIFGDIFSQQPKGEKYRFDNLGKVVGHLCRAGYDALDNLSVSLKLRVVTAIKDRDHEAVHKILPKYYSEYQGKLREIDKRVEITRSKKDIGDFTIEHLHEYLHFMRDLQGIAIEIENAIPGILDYEEKHNASLRKCKHHEWVFWGVITFLGAILCTVGYWLVELFLFHRKIS